MICESDYDCLFYQAIMDAIYENKNEIAPDILFTYCGGKQRIETVVKALRAVNVPVIAIADIDILDNETILQRTTEAFGMTWGSISTHLKKITDYAKDQRHQLVNSDVKIKLTEIANNLPSNTQSLSNSVADEIKAVLKQSSAWTKIKETGKTFFKGEEYSAWQAMDEQFSEIGLFIVPVGEIESFYKPAGGHGSKWWENVVQSSVNFATDSELSAARKFVQAIADF